jgi:hypothetical protein
MPRPNTEKRPTIPRSPHPHCQYMVACVPLPRQLRAQVKIQWKRILWDLRGDSLTKYRQKLQSHADSINLLLSTFIWSVHVCLSRINRSKLYNFRSATDRIEVESKHHAHKLNELLYQTSQFNKTYTSWYTVTCN